MTIFMHEEKETDSGTEWVEFSITDTDIIDLYIGLKEISRGRIIRDDFCRHTLIGENIAKMYDFTKSSNHGDSLTLEYGLEEGADYRNGIDYTRLLITDKTEWFHLEVLREIRARKFFKVITTFSESYSYDIDRSTFMSASEELNERYLSNKY